MQASMLLRQSNLKLQEELRDTMKCYSQEKSMLKSQLANLRLDLDELHHETRTISSDDSASVYSSSTDSVDGLLKKSSSGDQHQTPESDEAKTLKLPGIKSKFTKKAKKDRAENKNLRFTSKSCDKAEKGSATEENSNYSWDVSKQEKQKMLEMEALRNAGRVHLREKRMSLIRLPTISSAKRRTALWDSGKNVSRPGGKSTAFETYPYVQASIDLKQKTFHIPKIKDPQRSEIQIGGLTTKSKTNKRKVQFTRPQPDFEHSHDKTLNDSHQVINHLGDTTLADSTLDNVSFDEDGMLKPSKILNDTTLDDSMISSEAFPDKIGDTADTTIQISNSAERSDLLPPLKLKPLAKKNVKLHDDLNSLRTGDSIPKLCISPKHSDRSTNTKISQLSEETEEWKGMYLNIPDTEKRNKTLADIMFAVRSRMRENEATLRFGETPRPKDHTFCDFLLPKSKNTTPRKSNDGSPRKAKIKKRKPARGPPNNAASRAQVRTNKSSLELQTYLHRMYRQRRTIERMAGEEYRLAHFAGHKELQLIAQQA